MRDKKKNLVLHDYARYFFIIAIVVVLSLFFWVISPFFNVLIYASLIAVIFHPLHRFFVKQLRAHPSVSAFFTTLIVTLVVLTPLALFIIFLTQEALNAYEILDNKLVELDFAEFEAEHRISDLPIVGPWWESLVVRYGLDEVFQDQFDALQVIKDLGQNLSTFLVAQSTTIVKSVGNTLLTLFILLLTTFFFFRDGDKIKAFLKKMSPLPNKYENEIENKLKDTTYAIVMGYFVTSFLQGLAGAVGFAIAGVHNVIFWGTLMAFGSLIPYLGASLIWFPVGLALVIQGDWMWGIFVWLWGVGLVSVVDNVARPFLIGSRTKMHPLATFLVVLGGIFIFGLKGIIFGPLILSLTVTIIHIYQLEYRNVLKA